MAPVPSVGRAFFPLDEELGLLGGGLTPRAEEVLVRRACWMPFARARELLEELVGVQVSKATARRATLGAGAAALAVLEEEAKRLKQELPEVPKGAQKQAMSAVESFEEAALVETHRRGVEKATAVCAVQDGAEWLPGFVDYHRADAVRILDFAHAAEHISDLGNAAIAAGSGLASDWLSKQLHELKHHGPSQVLADLRALVAKHPEVKEQSSHLAYLQKREAQMGVTHLSGRRLAHRLWVCGKCQ